MLCVSIRTCAKSPNVTVCIPDKRAEKSEIFPGIPLPRPRCFSTPKEVGLGLSQTAAAAKEAIQICCDFPSLLWLPAFFSGEQSRAPGFLPIAPHSALQAADQVQVPPWPHTAASLETSGPAGLRPPPGRWVVLPPPPPSPEALRSCALGVCARARGTDRETFSRSR